MKQLSRKRRVATWLASLLVLFLAIGLLPTGFSKEVMAGNNKATLTIHKNIEAQGQLPEANYDFQFEVLVMQNGTEYYNQTVTLYWKKTGNNKEIKIEDLPVGASFSVKEILTGEFSLDSISGQDGVEIVKENATISGTLKKNTKVIFNNLYGVPGTGPGPDDPEPEDDDPPKLIVEKVVAGSPPQNDEFTFYFKDITEAGSNSDPGDPFTLPDSGNYQKEFDATPEHEYKITEEPTEGYTTTVMIYVDGSDEGQQVLPQSDLSGRLCLGYMYPVDAESVRIVFTNTWVEPDPKLIVEKIVDGPETDEKFDFQVTDISPSDGPTINAFVLNTPFDLVNGESEEMIAVPGTKYKVTETTREGYEAQITVKVKYGLGEDWQELTSLGFSHSDNEYSVDFTFPDEAIEVLVTFTNTWEDEGGDEDDGGTSGGDPVEEPGGTSGGDDPGEESDDTPDTDSGDETPGGETPGDEIVAGDEDEKPDEVVKGDEDEKAEDEELDVPVTGEGLSSYPFLALVMALLAVAFLALGKRKPLEED